MNDKTHMNDKNHKNDDDSNHITGELTDPNAVDSKALRRDIAYPSIPHKELPPDDREHPVWRIRFELLSDVSRAFGMLLNDEIVMGRNPDGKDNFYDLTPYGAESLGVSRVHFSLRPTVSNLFIVDEGSTNGTYVNGQPIGINNPQSLFDNDTIAAGKLKLVIRIEERPSGHTAALRFKADLADVLTQTAKAITSQLDLNDILKQVAESASTLVEAGEVGVWLLDKESGDLYLEAEWGIEDERIRRLRIAVGLNNPVGKVIRTGEVVHMTRTPGEDKIKIKTDYLVEALMYVPLKLGGVTFGVLAASHREAGKTFDERDERVLTAIGDFAAVAVQNARLYKAADDALAQRVNELAALNDLSSAVSSSLDLKKVYEVLLEQVNKHWDIDHMSLWLYDEKTKTPYVFGNGDYEPSEAKTEIVNSVLEEGKPLLYSDLLAKKAKEKVKDEKEATLRMTAQSILGVPLHVQGRTVGALTLFAQEMGKFKESDILRLQSFANPVATAVSNARLYAETEHKQATVEATMNTLGQPLLIIDDRGEVIIANESASQLVTMHMAQVFEGLSAGIGKTTEMTVGETTYLTTSQHVENVGTIVIMQDITYVKKLEDARTEFVQALSHDLKSPLASIKGWSYLLPQINELNEKGKEFVGRIGDATDSVLDMLSGLLDIALLSDSPSVERRATDLDIEVQKAMRSVEGAALAKKQKIEYQVEGTPFTIKGDSMRLYRTILNLLDNAVKYSPVDSTIKINIKYSKQAVRIEVSDEGEGIPDSDLPNLFERYFRGEQTLGNQPGIGLGLSLVQATVKAHGGEVTAENVKGGGARFTIVLPADTKPDTEPFKINLPKKEPGE